MKGLFNCKVHDKPYGIKSNGIPSGPIVTKGHSVFFGVVLLIVWMNYINLTISLVTKRAKELLARKTAGA